MPALLQVAQTVFVVSPQTRQSPVFSVAMTASCGAGGWSKRARCREHGEEQEKRRAGRTDVKSGRSGSSESLSREAGVDERNEHLIARGRVDAGLLPSHRTYTTSDLVLPMKAYI